MIQGKTITNMVTDDYLDAYRYGYDYMHAYMPAWDVSKKRTKSGTRFVYTLTHRETGHKVKSRVLRKATKEMEAFDAAHKRLTSKRPKQSDVGESWWYNTAGVAR